MLKIALKGAIARRRRFISTIVAVAIGIGFVAGAQIFSTGLSASFDDLFATTNQGLSGYVRSTAAAEGIQGGTQHAAIPESTIALVAGVDGVLAARGDYQGTAVVIKPDGKPLVDVQGPPQLGLEWSDVGALNSFQVVEGNAPQADNQIVIDKAAATKGKIALGSAITIITSKGSSSVIVAGIAKFGSSDSPLGASAVLFSPARAKAEYAINGQPLGVNVVAKPGVDVVALKQRITAVLPGGIQALTGDELRKESQNDLKDGLSIISTALSGFAYVALFVSAFVIANTFSILVGQRIRELALFRAIGASRRQIVGSVTAEALIVGLVGGVVGLLAGFGFAYAIKSIFKSAGATLPGLKLSLPVSTIVGSLFLGAFTTVAVSFLPALRASKVPPVTAMRGVALDSSAASKSRRIAGVILIAIAAASLTSSIAQGKFPLFGLGMGALIIAVVVLGPVIARPIALALGKPIQEARKPIGRFARENAARNPRRTASTAVALMIGATLVTIITIFAQSVKTTVSNQIDKSLKSDYTIRAVLTGLPPEIVTQIRELPEVRSAIGLNFLNFNLNKSSQTSLVVDVKSITGVLDPHVIHGSINDMGPNGIAVDDSLMKDNGWTLGQTLTADFPKSGQDPGTITIKAVYTDDGAVLGQTLLVDRPFASANFDPSNDRFVLVNKNSSASAEETKSALTKTLAAFPNVKINDITGVKADVSSQINGILQLILALLAFAVVIALFGIANTLSLSINERTREIGLLRAVGMSKKQVRAAVRWEAVIISIFGAVLGVVLGIFGGWALLRVLAADGSVTFAIPSGQIGIILVTAALAGVIAALRPAHRAAKLDILAAIATN